MKKDLSIIIPVKNEGGNISALLGELKCVADGLGVDYEIVVVDGCSDDDTVSLARALADKVIVQKEPGYGNALKEAFSASSGEYMLTMDGDLSHSPGFIRDIYGRKDSADLVIASRYVPGGRAIMPRWRKLLSIILNRVFSRVLSLPIRDISSGFRLYRSDILKGMDLRREDFSILEEIAILMWDRGYRVAEVPFTYNPRAEGRSKAKLWAFGLSYMRTIFSMWKIRNSYETADYDERAYDSIIPFQRYWQRRRYSIIKGLVGEGGAVLDIGCGSSRIIGSLPRAVGLDLALNKLRYLRKTNSRLVNASIFALPFRAGSFDFVICSEVIEHVPFDASLFDGFSSLLKEGGVLIVGTPDYGRLSWRVIERIYGLVLPNAYKDEHITHYDSRQLKRLLAEKGFLIEKCAYVFGSELIIRARKGPRSCPPGAA